MICEHGEKLNKFCIMDNCKHPISAGCTYCYKKNHFHLGVEQSITLEQVEELANNLNSKNNQQIRPKQNILKQLLFHYFQDLKKNIVSSLQKVKISMLDSISYPYLFQIGLVSAYKKLNSPQLKKISPQQMHQLYKFNLSNTTLNREKKQKQYYVKGVINLQRTLQSIKNVFQAYQSEISQFDNQFVQGEGLFKKIINVTNAIKEKNTNVETQEQLQPILIKEKPILQVPKKNRDRKVSFDVSNQLNSFKLNKNNPEHLKTVLQKSSSMKQQQTQEMTQKQIFRLNKRKLLLSQMKRLNQQLQNIQSRSHQEMYQRQEENDRISQQYFENQNQIQPQSYKQGQSNHEIYKIKISQINKPQDKNNKVLHNNKQKIRKLSQNLMSSPFQKLTLQPTKKLWKECESQTVSESDQQIDNAALPHPPNKQQFRKSYSYDAQETKPKTFKLQVNGLSRNMSNRQMNEIQSPIIRKKAQQKQKADFKLDLKKSSSPIQQLNKVKTLDQMVNHLSEQVQQEQVQQYSQTSSSHNKVQVFSEGEIKSLALFTESLKLNPQEAIHLLKSALIYCPQNLSAAQYLSYLLLQQNQPKQCLQVCDDVINKISVNNCNKQDYFSVHIINNKAAALNQLGRFSQTISLLERCHQFHQKQSQNELLFKNLGDAYFSLGIYQKATTNYQKSIKISDKYDQAIYNLAVCYYIQQNYKDCNKYITRATVLNPFNSQYKDLYSNCKQKLKK